MRVAKSSRKGSSNVVSSVLLTVISIAAVALFAVFVFSILNRVDFEVVGTPKIIRDSSGKYYLEINIHNTGTRDIVKLEVSAKSSGISIGNLLDEGKNEVLQAGKEKSFVKEVPGGTLSVGSQVLLTISAYTSTSSSSPDTVKTATAVVTQV
jgi:hypothetical protein